MKMLGKQTYKICGGTTELNLVEDIVNAYNEYGDNFDKLITTIILKYGKYGLISNIFNIGYICGQRQERQKKGRNKQHEIK